MKGKEGVWPRQRARGEGAAVPGRSAMVSRSLNWGVGSRSDSGCVVKCFLGSELPGLSPDLQWWGGAEGPEALYLVRRSHSHKPAGPERWLSLHLELICQHEGVWFSVTAQGTCLLSFSSPQPRER